MSQWDVDGCACSTSFSGGRDPCCSTTNRFANSVCHRRREEGVTMFFFTIGPDQTCFPVALYRNIHCFDETRSHFFSKANAEIENLR